MQEVYEKDNYIFVSYAHKDASVVLPLIEMLRKNGYTVWYDQGIEAGTEWPEYIAERIQECGVFLACISPAAMQSNNCRNEINFALSLQKDCLTIYLEETNMTAGMQLQLGSLQALFRHRHKNEQSFYNALANATLLQRIKRVPAPVQSQIAPAVAPTVAPAVAPAPTTTETSEEPTSKRAQPSAKAKKLDKLSAVFAFLIAAMGYASSWAAGTYIHNTFFAVVTMMFVPIAYGTLLFAIIRKKIQPLDAVDQREVVNTLGGWIVIMAILSLIIDPFFMVCAKKVIFKILVALAINVVRYFILIAASPSVTKKV